MPREGCDAQAGVLGLMRMSHIIMAQILGRTLVRLQGEHKEPHDAATDCLRIDLASMAKSDEEPAQLGELRAAGQEIVHLSQLASRLRPGC